MTFVSKRSGDHSKGYTVTGDLTIRDVTKSVTLEMTPVKGPIKDGWGNTRVASVATTTINRQDFWCELEQHLGFRRYGCWR